MANSYTAVSVQADKIYVKALGRVADGRGVTSGELTREALDLLYGEEIRERIEDIVREQAQSVSRAMSGQSAIHSNQSVIHSETNDSVAHE